jgi:hypothetical protein
MAPEPNRVEAEVIDHDEDNAHVFFRIKVTEGGKSKVIQRRHSEFYTVWKALPRNERGSLPLWAAHGWIDLVDRIRPPLNACSTAEDMTRGLKKWLGDQMRNHNSSSRAYVVHNFLGSEEVKKLFIVQNGRLCPVSGSGPAQTPQERSKRGGDVGPRLARQTERRPEQSDSDSDGENSVVGPIGDPQSFVDKYSVCLDELRQALDSKKQLRLVEDLIKDCLIELSWIDRDAKAIQSGKLFLQIQHHSGWQEVQAKRKDICGRFVEQYANCLMECKQALDSRNEALINVGYLKLVWCDRVAEAFQLQSVDNFVQLQSQAGWKDVEAKRERIEEKMPCLPHVCHARPLAQAQ